MPRFADLNKEDAAAEMIHHFLPTHWIPPFDGIVRLATGHDDPEWHILTGDLLNLRHPRLLLCTEVNIPFERGGLDIHSQLGAEIRHKAVNEMNRAVIAIVDQGIGALDLHSLLVGFRELRQVGIISPQSIACRSNVDRKPTGVGETQIAHSRSEHDHIARGLEIPEDNFPHAA